jgi:hypothetical protein
MLSVTSRIASVVVRRECMPLVWAGTAATVRTAFTRLLVVIMMCFSVTHWATLLGWRRVQFLQAGGRHELGSVRVAGLRRQRSPFPPLSVTSRIASMVARRECFPASGSGLRLRPPAPASGSGLRLRPPAPASGLPASGSGLRPPGLRLRPPASRPPAPAGGDGPAPAATVREAFTGCWL